MRSQEQQDAEEVMSMLKAIEAAGKDLNPETASEEVKVVSLPGLVIPCQGQLTMMSLFNLPPFDWLFNCCT
jgi:hypothetical protein